MGNARRPKHASSEPHAFLECTVAGPAAGAAGWPQAPKENRFLGVTYEPKKGVTLLEFCWVPAAPADGGPMFLGSIEAIFCWGPL